MAKQMPGSKQMIAFKIGARARKFAVEGCPIEGYDYLYGCLADARARDPELYALLQVESDKFDRRMADIDAETDAEFSATDETAIAAQKE